MGLKVFATTFAAVTLTAGAALAAPVADQFKNLCLSTTTTAEATARARAEGYVKAPAALRSRLNGFPDSGEALVRTSDGEMTLFISASMKREMASSSSQVMTGDVCTVASMSAEPALKNEIETVLNVGPAQSFGRMTGYIFEETEQGRVRLDAADNALVGVKTVQGTIRTVAILEQPGMSGLMLIAPRIGAK